MTNAIRESAAVSREVLIVDDEPNDRTLLRDALVPEDYQVTEAADGSEALAIVRERLPDVVLLDVMMPRLDGLEVCRRVKADSRSAPIPVILVTAQRGQEGAGATFWFERPMRLVTDHSDSDSNGVRLDVPPPHPGAVTDASLQVAGPCADKERYMAMILVVDDEALIRDTLQDFLQMSRYTVVAASDGATALAACRATPTDLVITDMLTPSKDGQQLIADLFHEFPDVKIIAMSASSASLAGARQLGVQGTLTKPFELDELLELVRQLFGDGD